MLKVHRHKTALRRVELSRPIRLALEDGVISEKSRVFDYGCGLGGDVRRLRDRGIKADGWDPVHAPREKRRSSDIVNFGYVANVIENPDERQHALREAWSLTDGVLVVSARLNLDARFDASPAFGDGVVTKLGTFQKYFDQTELRAWIDHSLGVSAVPASPGVFYVFRGEDAREQFVASRYRRRLVAPRVRRSEVLFEQHRSTFEALQKFVLRHGRAPGLEELPEGVALCQAVGSIPKAFEILKRVTSQKEWADIRDARTDDVLVYLALARFDGRPRFSRMPRSLQHDIRAFFGTYRVGCATADRLLFSIGARTTVDEACRASTIGKLTPSALYVHESALVHLSPTLRVYEGCARRYVGAVRGANVSKLHRDGGTISYLAYPDFESRAHPALLGALVVSLRTFRLTYRDYRGCDNPPILHRKECFVGAEHPLRARWERATRREERMGLYSDTSDIGTRSGWERALLRVGRQSPERA